MKTYRNEKYKFELQYPNDWKYEEDDRSRGLTVDLGPASASDDRAFLASAIDLTVKNTPVGTSLNQYAQQTAGAEDNSRERIAVEITTIGGVDARRIYGVGFDEYSSITGGNIVSSTTTPPTFFRYVFYHNGKAYTFDDRGIAQGESQELATIISSFKFPTSP